MADSEVATEQSESTEITSVQDGEKRETVAELMEKMWSAVETGKDKELRKFFNQNEERDIPVNRDNEEFDEDGGHVLIFCVKEGCSRGNSFGRDFVQCVRILLTNEDLDINVQDKSERTALHWAVLGKNVNFCTLLMNAGADPTIEDHDGLSPFHIAIQKGYKDILKILSHEQDREIFSKKDGKGTPPLVTAVNTGNVDICRYLLENGAKIDATDRRLKRSALQYAILAKNLDIFDLLLKYNPSLDQGDYRGKTALHRICAIKDPRYFQRVIKHYGTFPDHIMEQETDDGVTPVISACQSGNSQQLKELIDQGASILTKDDNGRTALHYCADNLETQCAEMLLAKEPSLLEVKDSQGFTPLHMSVISGNVPLLKLLLKKGADIRSLDSELHTPTHWATGNTEELIDNGRQISTVCGHLEILDILIDNGAELSSADSHNAYPIHYAAQMNGKDSNHADSKVGEKVLKKLLDSGVPHDVTDKDGRQPLLWAASAGNTESIKLLVKAGADVNAIDKDGLSALHCAASRGHSHCIEELKKLGADVNLADKNSCTPLFYAVTLGNKDCTKTLLKHGADPNHKDVRGRTPGHCASVKGCVETLKILDKSKADLWGSSGRGDFPIHEAAQGGHCDVVKYLLKWKNEPEAVNTPNNAGRTCLHIAAIINNLPLCKLLLDNGAEKNSLMMHKNKKDASKDKSYTPYDAAILKDNRETADYIKSKGGNSGGDIDNILNKKDKRDSKSAKSRKSNLESHKEEEENPEQDKKSEKQEDTEAGEKKEEKPKSKKELEKEKREAEKAKKEEEKKKKEEELKAKKEEEKKKKEEEKKQKEEEKKQKEEEKKKKEEEKKQKEEEASKKKEEEKEQKEEAEKDSKKSAEEKSDKKEEVAVVAAAAVVAAEEKEKDKKEKEEGKKGKKDSKEGKDSKEKEKEKEDQLESDEEVVVVKGKKVVRKKKGYVKDKEAEKARKEAEEAKKEAVKAHQEAELAKAAAEKAKLEKEKQDQQKKKSAKQKKEDKEEDNKGKEKDKSKKEEKAVAAGAVLAAKGKKGKKDPNTIQEEDEEEEEDETTKESGIEAEKAKREAEKSKKETEQLRKETEEANKEVENLNKAAVAATAAEEVKESSKKKEEKSSKGKKDKEDQKKEKEDTKKDPTKPPKSPDKVKDKKDSKEEKAKDKKGKPTTPGSDKKERDKSDTKEPESEETSNEKSKPVTPKANKNDIKEPDKDASDKKAEVKDKEKEEENKKPQNKKEEKQEEKKLEKEKSSVTKVEKTDKQSDKSTQKKEKTADDLKKPDNTEKSKSDEKAEDTKKEKKELQKEKSTVTKVDKSKKSTEKDKIEKEKTLTNLKEEDKKQKKTAEKPQSQEKSQKKTPEDKPKSPGKSPKKTEEKVESQKRTTEEKPQSPEKKQKKTPEKPDTDDTVDTGDINERVDSGVHTPGSVAEEEDLEKHLVVATTALASSGKGKKKNKLLDQPSTSTPKVKHRPTRKDNEEKVPSRDSGRPNTRDKNDFQEVELQPSRDSGNHSQSEGRNSQTEDRQSQTKPNLVLSPSLSPVEYQENSPHQKDTFVQTPKSRSAHTQKVDDEDEFEFPENSHENEEAALRLAESRKKSRQEPLPDTTSLQDSEDRESRSRRKASKIPDSGVIQPGLKSRSNSRSKTPVLTNGHSSKNNDYVETSEEDDDVITEINFQNRLRRIERAQIARNKQKEQYLLQQLKRTQKPNYKLAPVRKHKSNLTLADMERLDTSVRKRNVPRRVASIQESVRRYQDQRRFVRQMHQLKRAQIYTGPMHDIVLFSKMMDVYKHSTPGESEIDLEMSTMENWDSYLRVDSDLNSTGPGNRFNSPAQHTNCVRLFIK
ncbi:uncharacterized protein LOC111129666 isoform X11 [Crassostrea virginica]